MGHRASKSKKPNTHPIPEIEKVPVFLRLSLYRSLSQSFKETPQGSTVGSTVEDVCKDPSTPNGSSTKSTPRHSRSKEIYGDEQTSVVPDGSTSHWRVMSMVGTENTFKELEAMYGHVEETQGSTHRRTPSRQFSVAPSPNPKLTAELKDVLKTRDDRRSGRLSTVDLDRDRN
jgi:hypothetical protein